MSKIKKEEKMVITEIKGTPFSHTKKDEKNYLICGKVVLETDKEIEEIKKWLEKKPWEAIALLAQGILYELSKK